MIKHSIQSVVSFLHLIILIGLLSACAADGDRMRQQLYDLQARNQADSLMTNDSLATALCTWFDRHGTPNERMLAHYLMGRTWADKGEAPQALEEYHTAADCADTTATDCDYRLLCRIYAQMSGIFYQQNLMDYYLKSLDSSIKYANIANDIPVALNSFAYKMAAYDRMNLPDSVTTTYEKVYDRYCQENDTITGIRFFGLAFGSYVLTGQLIKARYYMELYERESGFFDAEGNIEKGREIYYYMKGNYYLAIQQYDSAEYYFRKQLNNSQTFNNLNAASRGLALLYQQTSKLDSTAKYAMFSYEMNDSVYSSMALAEVSNVEALYNYTRHQKIAEQEKESLQRTKRRAQLYVLTVICLTVGIIAYALLIRNKRREELKAFLNQKELLRKRQEELHKLKSNEIQLESLIKEKKDEIRHFQASMAHFKIVPPDNDEETRLKNTTAFQELFKSTSTIRMLSSKEWETLENLIKEHLPAFVQFLEEEKVGQNITAHHVCILLRLHIRVKDIGNILGVTSAYVSKISRNLLNDIWKVDGSSKDLMKILESI